LWDNYKRYYIPVMRGPEEEEREQEIFEVVMAENFQILTDN
jgi:hypothetical protein